MFAELITYCKRVYYFFVFGIPPAFEIYCPYVIWFFRGYALLDYYSVFNLSPSFYSVITSTDKKPFHRAADGGILSVVIPLVYCKDFFGAPCRVKLFYP